VEVDDSLRRRAEREGEACRQWLAGLDGLIGELERDWAIEVGAPMTGGTAAFVAEVTRADGSPAVLKLVMPAEREGREDLAHEVLALRVAGGRGCVRVLKADVDRGAVLLERLGRQLTELGYPVGRQLRIICATLAPVWTVPPDRRLPGLADKGRFLAAYIRSTWAELDHPCSSRVVDLAAECAERRAAAFDPATAVLVHGDAHGWNTLEDPAARRPDAFRLVDPDGLAGEPEYDLAIPMREYNEELLAGDTVARGAERARLLARITGSDARKIWEWGYVERVSTGLLAVKEEFTDARDFLEVAERWAAADEVWGDFRSERPGRSFRAI
jgi:streptomycin 6-kinase